MPETKRAGAKWGVPFQGKRRANTLQPPEELGKRFSSFRVIVGLRPWHLAYLDSISDKLDLSRAEVLRRALLRAKLSDIEGTTPAEDPKWERKLSRYIEES